MIMSYESFPGALGQSTKDSYCFQFTWLGPKYTNESAVNGTCEDLGDRVCANPLVYTCKYFFFTISVNYYYYIVCLLTLWSTT